MTECQTIETIHADEPVSDRVTVDRGSAPMWRRLLNWRWCLILLIALFCVIGGGGYALLKAEPEYWRERRDFLKTYTPQHLTAMSENLERKILAGLTGVSTAADSMEPVDVGGQGPRVVRISTNEVNAWLDRRLPGWLSNQGKKLPTEIRQPMVAIEDGNLILAFRYQSDQFDQIISGIFHFHIQENGKAKIRLQGIKGGVLRVPSYAVTRQFNSRSGVDTPMNKVSEMLSAAEGVTFDPVWAVDTHVIRVLAVTVRGDGIDLTVAGDPGPIPSP